MAFVNEYYNKKTEKILIIVSGFQEEWENGTEKPSEVGRNEV